MESETYAELLLLFILIMFNAFFAASEIAIVSLNKAKIEGLAKTGGKRAKLLLDLINEPSKFLATIQIGITLGGFFASASAALNLSEDFKKILDGIPYLTQYSGQLSVIFVTIILSYFTLVLGELVPKRLAQIAPEKIAMFSVYPVYYIEKLFSPFIAILSMSTNFILRIFNQDKKTSQEKITEEELKLMIEVSEEHGVINEIEKEMIRGVFSFDNTLAKQIIIHRKQVFMIDINAPIDEIIESVMAEKYSRIPLYEEEFDNIIGVLNHKDLFDALWHKGKENIDLREIMRPPYFVQDSKHIDVLFRELQQTKNHMAIIIDEYGGFLGIITMEDLVEEVVGNIADEHDEDEICDIQKIDENSYILNGSASIKDINEKLLINLDDKNVETISGFLIDLIGYIPDKPMKVNFENLEFEITSILYNKIEKVKLHFI